MLRQAFYRLMNDTKEPNIHHQTFYKHFQTKQDFYINVCDVNKNLFYNKYKDLKLFDLIKNILEKRLLYQKN